MADIQADNYRSSLRNKLVGEAFYLTGNIEKYGSGFIRIRKALQDYPEIDFEIKEFSGGVMVTFAQRGGVSGGVNSLLSYVQSNLVPCNTCFFVGWVSGFMVRQAHHRRT